MWGGEYFVTKGVGDLSPHLPSCGLGVGAVESPAPDRPARMWRIGADSWPCVWALVRCCRTGSGGSAERCEPRAVAGAVVCAAGRAPSVPACSHASGNRSEEMLTRSVFSGHVEEQIHLLCAKFSSR